MWALVEECLGEVDVELEAGINRAVNAGREECGALPCKCQHSRLIFNSPINNSFRSAAESFLTSGAH